MASRTRIIIVTGPPASGKTTLAAQLAADLSLPAITKDGIKEALLDAVGSVDRESSERLGRGSWEVLWHLLEVELAAQRSALFEGNFSAEHSTTRLAELSERYEFAALQVHCFAAADLLYSRYRDRIAERHPGHADTERLADTREVFDSARYLLAIPGNLISIDTTSFDKVEYQRIRDAALTHLTSTDS